MSVTFVLTRLLGLNRTPLILCCLLLTGADQKHGRTPPVPEFPPEIILPAEKDDLLLRVPKDPVPDWKDPDWEDFTSPFLPSSPPFKLHDTNDQEQ